MSKALAKADESPARDGVPAVPITREQARADRQLLHGAGVASHVYAQQIEVVANDPELQQTAFGHAAAGSTSATR